MTSADINSSSAYPIIGVSAQAEILTFAVGTSSQTAAMSARDAAAETHAKSAKIHFFHSSNFAGILAPYRPRSLHVSGFGAHELPARGVRWPCKKWKVQKSNPHRIEVMVPQPRCRDDLGNRFPPRRDTFAVTPSLPETRPTNSSWVWIDICFPANSSSFLVPYK